MQSEKRLIIFDTTLRDGEQSPGASMNLAEKLEIAHALKDLGVDIIEAGFPIASPGDFESVQAIAREVHGPTICGLARCNPADIDRAWEALKDAPKRRIHVFLATSAIHREFKLKMAKEEIVSAPSRGVSRPRAMRRCRVLARDARSHGARFPRRGRRKAVEAGATTVNIPDTVGYAIPGQYAEAIRHLKKTVRGIDKVVISVHCHNDLGLAVANSLAALKEGARQIECTINGLGERAGNCALEEVVMAVRTRKDYFDLHSGINTKRLCPISRLVSRITGLPVQRNKAIVGRNAFAHEAGIHQDGMLKERSTYEIMNPEDVGLSRTELVLGKHSGRHALRARVRDLGYHLNDAQLNRVFDGFKVLADKKKEIYDADVEALAEAEIHGISTATWSLESFHTSRGHRLDPGLRGLPASCRRATREAACAMGPSMPSSNHRTHHRHHRRASRLQGSQRHRWRGCQGEATVEVMHGGKSLLAVDQHRHHRGQCPGVPAGDQPHRRPASAGNAGGSRAGRGGGSGHGLMKTLEKANRHRAQFVPVPIGFSCASLSCYPPRRRCFLRSALPGSANLQSLHGNCRSLV